MVRTAGEPAYVPDSEPLYRHLPIAAVNWTLTPEIVNVLPDSTTVCVQGEAGRPRATIDAPEPHPEKVAEVTLAVVVEATVPPTEIEQVVEIMLPLSVTVPVPETAPPTAGDVIVADATAANATISTAANVAPSEMNFFMSISSKLA